MQQGFQQRSPVAFAITALAIGLGGSTAAFAQGGSPGQSAGSPATQAQSPAPGATSIKGPTVAASTLTITGKVADIDRTDRKVVVRDDDGRVATLTVGPNVRNFDAIDKGDRVTMLYTEAVSLAIAEGGLGTEAELGEIRTKVESDAARQAKNGAPGMAAVEQATMVANVFRIDRDRGVVTLRGTDGVPVDIKVPDQQALSELDLNDQVVVGYRQAAAVSIQPGGDAGGMAGSASPDAASPSR